MLIGRHRLRTHAGLPTGSTIAAGAKLEFWYQCNTGETGARWNDQSANGNNALQEAEGNQPSVVSGGGLDFEDTNESESASQMVMTSFNVPANNDFLSFIVCKIEDSINSHCYLSDSGSEVFQFTSGNQHQFKAVGATPMTHSSVFSVSPDEKVLFMVHRTNTSTGTLKLYKNGLVCDGHNNSGSTNANTFDIQNLGVKNNPTNESNWFDGIIYDVGMIVSTAATDKARDMITDYLCGKHGIKREG
jgi:hypothetical protein